ncbi:sodium:solute symporter family protein [Microbulbifer elongatus]|uniref:sodium:solute symporter family protein n=1 Tax=Microbulbifer elongatus TaxID=86173 RepID=UPI001CFF392E|nr:sodium:solute symporter family protein [Microbulbifer elongatus]
MYAAAGALRSGRLDKVAKKAHDGIEGEIPVMQVTGLDWTIIAITLGTILLVGSLVARRASKDSASYFLGGRRMPWWLLGTSMVATTFAADTPNLVSDLVRSGGVSANWSWWCFLLTGMLTAFVYAKLWRRLGVTTDNEFYERRYTGRPAAFLRGFRAIYLGVFFNVLIMGSVTLAAIKFGAVLFDLPPEVVVLVAGGITVIFSVAGGLLGVLITDLILFVIAMTGAIFAAYFALEHPAVGGLHALTQHADVIPKMAMLPDFSDMDALVTLLIVPLAVQWWASWYPGAEPGGGGFVAQRMLAARNERHAVAATVFFNFAHYALRPWPWILVALASLIVFPDLASLQQALPNVDPAIVRNDLAYPAMLTFLPAGILGLVLASIVAAYVSTISTSLNWGASYLVNDVFVRFVAPDASQRAQVMAGRVITVLLMVLAALLALQLESATQGFNLLLSVGAGTGLLFLLRWFWHRINAWSEISAMAISFSVSCALAFTELGLAQWQVFALSVAITTVGWVGVTLLTPKTDAATLAEFDRVNREYLAGESVRTGITAMLWAVLAVYSLLFGTGHALYGNTDYALGFALAALIGTWKTVRNILAISETDAAGGALTASTSAPLGTA